ncbi:MAG: four helix bundle protein [Bacteroidales bacterium]|nr:four helix bundle protein [Bacteroidales bacterium]MCF8402519.1 four helix bundle protein [Bacteroidales bacterium]
MEIVKQVYKATEGFPENEKFGLTSQIRRCAVSIPSNIAEGSGRNHDKEFIQFLYFSLGSLSELETQLLISGELNYIDDLNTNELTDSIEINRKLVLGLVKYLKNKKENN